MKLYFCTECAAPLSQTSTSTYTCTNGHPYWNNPKAAVAVVLLKDDTVLVSKRGIEPRKGTYDFPGGFIEYNEDALAAAKREMLEETGLRVDNFEILTTYVMEYVENISVLDLLLIARTWHGDMQPQDDSAALEWKPVDFLDRPEFAAPYHGLSTTLRAYITRQ
jgi:NAD+ diphosphatase